MTVKQDKQLLWNDILTRLREKVPYADFITWFKSTAVIDDKDDKLTVGVSMPIAAKWLKDRFHSRIVESVKEVDTSYKDVLYELDAKLSQENDPRLPNPSVFKKNGDKIKVRKSPRVAEFKTASGLTSKILDERYTLENFVVGPGSRLAHAACTAVATEPGKRYNPLFIYGNVGLGKTHLLQGVGNGIKKRNQNALVIYVTAETFGNNYVTAIKTRKMDQFNNRYRKVDVLIIDDIQFFAGKKGMQEAFFHVFNTLYDSSKQVIISSDRPPKELDNIDQRLTSRFEMGMVADIEFPEFETRLAILQEKVRQHQVIIENKVLEFIAQNVHHSVRELEGVLMQAIAEAELEESTPTILSVERVLRKLNRETEIVGGADTSPIQSAQTVEDVISVVARHFGVNTEDVLGSRRLKEFVLPRQVAMYLIKEDFDHSLEHIGKLFGGRNHTTVLHGISTIRQRVTKDRSFSRDLNALRKEMGR
jgi:chromosomal replication initiator protein